MNNKSLTILLLVTLFPMTAFSDCKFEKRSIQELVYEEKSELIGSYCINHASYLNGFSSMIGLMGLGDNTSPSYRSSEKAYNNCRAENDLIRKVLKKDHDGYEIDLERDCPTWIDLYDEIDRTN